MASLIETAEKDDDLATFATAVKAAGMRSKLSKPGPFTVFAPTEAAFEAVPTGQLEDILDDEAQARRLVRNHIVEGRLKRSNLLEQGQVKTLAGNSVHIGDEGGLRVGKAGVLGEDIGCDNGICHTLDKVLMP